MDSVIKNLSSISSLLGQRRTKALLIGLFVAVSIIWLQIYGSPTPKPMVELFADCKLQGSDLNRIQLALGKTGLKDFQVRTNKLYVPQLKQWEYLQAIVAQEALPRAMNETQPIAGVSNPFLTHTQQQSLQREQRKRNLQDLIRMLPFVDQAWLEMDDSNDRFAYRQSSRSAVVSVRPYSHQPLMEPQVATIRELVAGAINGITTDQIVVIDLDSGNAFRGMLEEAPIEKKWTAQRAKFARQKWLEGQLREALECYPELEIEINICGPLMDSPDQLAIHRHDQTSTEVHIAGEGANAELSVEVASFESSCSTVFGSDSPSRIDFDPHTPSLRLYGANGRVSLDDWEPIGQAEIGKSKRVTASVQGKQLERRSIDVSSENPIAQVSFTTEPLDDDRGLLNQETQPTYQPLLKVTVRVPVALLLETNSNPGFRSVLTCGNSLLGNLSQSDLEHRFESFKTTIQSRMAPVLEIYQEEMATSLDIQLVGIEDLKLDWRESFAKSLEAHWPSMTVLLAGLVLIGLVGMSDRPRSSLASFTTREAGQSADGDQWITESCQIKGSACDAETEAMKARLSALIEKDPSSAARVIENWIRESNSN